MQLAWKSFTICKRDTCRGCLRILIFLSSAFLNLIAVPAIFIVSGHHHHQFCEISYEVISIYFYSHNTHCTCLGVTYRYHTHWYSRDKEILWLWKVLKIHCYSDLVVIIVYEEKLTYDPRIFGWIQFFLFNKKILLHSLKLNEW